MVDWLCEKMSENVKLPSLVRVALSLGAIVDTQRKV